MTDAAPLTDQQLADIRYRGERPSQYTAATIRRDYADLLAALTAATERAARFEAAYDKVLSIAAAEAKEAYEVGRNAAQDEVARLRAELAKRDDQLINLRAELSQLRGCPEHGHDCEPDDHIDPHTHQ